MNAPICTSVPSEKDWGDYNADLYQKHAYTVFARRTNLEMQPFFRRNPIEKTDELRWMARNTVSLLYAQISRCCHGEAVRLRVCARRRVLLPRPCLGKARRSPPVHYSGGIPVGVIDRDRATSIDREHDETDFLQHL